MDRNEKQVFIDNLRASLSESDIAVIVKQNGLTVSESNALRKKLFEAKADYKVTKNTLAKIASGITDTSVTMAAKAHLRSNRPLIIALASNDALSANLKNIGQLLTRKFVYFVPLYQDDPQKKPHSLIADFSLLLPTLTEAIRGEQYQKIFKE